MLRRYAELLNWVRLVRPASIIEVGAWDGGQATRMIRAASAFAPRISYTGYDLFELGDADIDAAELNGKSRVTDAGTRSRILAACPGASVTLVKGNTRETLRERKRADFAFIDGGHSVETIENDYRALAECPVIVFDDYYFDIVEGADVDTARHGCNSLIDGLAAAGDPDLAVGLLPAYDRFDHLGAIGMGFVVRRSHFPERLLVALAGGADGYAPPEKDALIDAVYRGLLGREADEGGRDIWLGRLETRSVENMLRDFVNTSEFRSRFRKMSPD